MKAACLAVPVSLLLALAAVAATVPEGSQLSISFRYRDNLNKLRNKGPGYAIQEDGYAQTIWVEGPHHPDSACTIARFERQNIKLVKVITYFAYGHNRANDDAVPNPWSRVDYNTPDFVAALISAGMYRYCPWSRTEGQSCTNGRVAPKDARRQDPTRGGMWRDKASVVCYPVNPARGHYAPLGDISAVTDGVSSATMYPGSTVTFTWDMRGTDSNLVQEGHYLVYCQFSAERYPRIIEQDTVVDGRVAVGIETCWDDPRYDELGQHRVVNLFHFRDSSFSVADHRERKWRGDPYCYLDGPVTFTYTTPGGGRKTPVSVGTKGCPTAVSDTTLRQGTRVRKYQDGAKLLEVTFKDNRAEGRVVRYHRNGSKSSEVTYKDGRCEGLYLEWHENGERKTRCSYRNGRVNGRVHHWHANGTKSSEFTCRDGRRVGRYQAWHEDSTRAQECTYRDGRLDGELIMWRTDGSVSKRCTYREGRLLECKEE